MTTEDICILEANTADQMNERIRKLLSQGYEPIGDLKVAFGGFVVMMGKFYYGELNVVDETPWPHPDSQTARAIREIENDN